MHGPDPKPEIIPCKEKSGPLRLKFTSLEFGDGAQLTDTLPLVRTRESALAVRVPQTQITAAVIVNKTTLPAARRAQTPNVLRDIVPPLHGTTGSRVEVEKTAGRKSRRGKAKLNGQSGF